MYYFQTFHHYIRKLAHKKSHGSHTQQMTIISTGLMTTGRRLQSSQRSSSTHAATHLCSSLPKFMNSISISTPPLAFLPPRQAVNRSLTFECCLLQTFLHLLQLELFYLLNNFFQKKRTTVGWLANLVDIPMDHLPRPGWTWTSGKRYPGCCWRVLDLVEDSLRNQFIFFIWRYENHTWPVVILSKLT